MRFDRRVRVAYIAALAALLIGGMGLRAAAGLLGVYLQKEPVPLRLDLATIPTTLGNWKRFGEDGLMAAATLEELGTKQYLTRNYALDGDPNKGIISLHLAYYTGGIDTVPHIPERCEAAAGLVQIGQTATLPLDIFYKPVADPSTPINRATGEPYAFTQVSDPVTRKVDNVAMPVGEMAIRAAVFQDPHSPQFVQHIGYFFVANGRITPSALGVRGLAFNLTDRYSYYCKVQVACKFPTSGSSPSELFKKNTDDFLKHLMPALMRCLPDWPSLETEAPKPTPTT